MSDVTTDHAAKRFDPSFTVWVRPRTLTLLRTRWFKLDIRLWTRWKGYAE